MAAQGFRAEGIILALLVSALFTQMWSSRLVKQR